MMVAHNAFGEMAVHSIVMYDSVWLTLADGSGYNASPTEHKAYFKAIKLNAVAGDNTTGDTFESGQRAVGWTR